MNDRDHHESPSPRALSKPCCDIGYFTENAAAVLDFWQRDMGLEVEEPVAFNDGLTQYRHTLGNSILKVNTASHALAHSACGYRELLIARAGLATPETLRDPDGNAITLVPPGHLGISALGVRVAVPDVALQRRFYCDAMGFTPLAADRVACGSTVFVLDEDAHAVRAGHWVDAGLRYLTIHVMRVDASFAAMTAAGAEPGEQPYDIGRIARISFVRDPQGNWLEVAQRAAIAGPWWED